MLTSGAHVIKSTTALVRAIRNTHKTLGSVTRIDATTIMSGLACDRPVFEKVMADNGIMFTTKGGYYCVTFPAS